MRLFAILFFSFLFFSININAGQAQEDKGAYFGLNATQSRATFRPSDPALEQLFGSDSIKVDLLSAGPVFGYQFNKRISIQGQYLLGINDAYDYSRTTLISWETKINTITSVLARLNLMQGNVPWGLKSVFNIYCLVGHTDINYSVDYDLESVGLSSMKVDNTIDGISYLLGFDYQASSNTFFFLEAGYYINNVEDTDVFGVSLGAKFKL